MTPADLADGRGSKGEEKGAAPRRAPPAGGAGRAGRAARRRYVWLCLLRFPEPLSRLGSCSVTVVGTAAAAPRHFKPEPGTTKRSSPALPPREGRLVKELLGSGPPRRWSSFSSLCRAGGRAGDRLAARKLLLKSGSSGPWRGSGCQPHRAVPHPTRWSLLPPGGGKKKSLAGVTLRRRACARAKWSRPGGFAGNVAMRWRLLRFGLGRDGKRGSSRDYESAGGSPGIREDHLWLRTGALELPGRSQ
ncbi:hypothetical protein E2320_011495 [Naja naja]|nr:hypothetical protein E2320_011495 [Naja naja]